MYAIKFMCGKLSSSTHSAILAFSVVANYTPVLRLEQSESCISSVHTYLKISSNCGFSPPFLAAKSGLGCKQPYRQSQKQQ